MRDPTSASSVQSLKNSQILLSQVLHDFISLFTALSAGIDLVNNHPEEIWPLVYQSQKRLNVYIHLVRFIFSPGEGVTEEAQRILLEYGSFFSIGIRGAIKEHCKLMLGLCFWLTKQCQNRPDSLLIISDNSLVFSAPVMRSHLEEDHMLQYGGTCRGPQDSYSHYLHALAAEQQIQIRVMRGANRTEISLVSRP